MRKQKNVILETKNLSKVYKKADGSHFTAVDNVSFTINRGEIFSYLGPNGAGKSTTIGLLTDQKNPSSGSVVIDGMTLSDHAAELKAKIGVVTQHNNLDRGLTAKENLIYHGLYFGMDRKELNERADHLLKEFGLKDWENDYVKSFSGGMVQRLKIARALVHKPDILFLDEPTTGLDPYYREILWDQMLLLNKEGTTVFLTTHYMEEPERFSDRIAIFANGSVKAIGTTQELKNMIPANTIVSLNSTSFDKPKQDQLKLESYVKEITVNKDNVKIYLKEQKYSTHLMKWVIDNEIVFDQFSISNATLDDVFIHLTNMEEQKHD